jgi:hypothetical protein
LVHAASQHNSALWMNHFACIEAYPNAEKAESLAQKAESSPRNPMKNIAIKNYRKKSTKKAK